MLYISHTKAKILVLVGSKERPIMKKSATKIVHLIPNSELEVLQGYYHGDISINHADDYVERVKRLVRWITILIIKKKEIMYYEKRKIFNNL